MSKCLINSPIGICDSGIGGVSVAQAMMQRLPNENILYFGDTEHMPYGVKTKEQIQQYTTDMIEYFISQNVKAVIIACNTATAAAKEVLAAYQDKVRIFNVVDPVVEYIVKHHAHHKVGLICTNLTYQLGIFEQKIEAHGEDIRLISLRASQLAHLVETEFENTEKLERLITEYCFHHHFKNVDAIILGCTHYVWLKRYFLKLNPYIDWVEPTQLLADAVWNYLTEIDLMNGVNQESSMGKQIPAEVTFCQSGDSQLFFDLVTKLVPASRNKKFIANLHLCHSIE